MQQTPDDLEEARRVVHVLERVRVHNTVDLERELVEVLDIPP